MEITDGTAQGRRLSRALKGGYFNADEWSFEQLLAASADFSACLKFFNSDNLEDGDWSQLFSAHRAVTAAAILSVDLKKEQALFSRAVTAKAPESVRQVLNLAQKIDHWHRQRIVDDGREQERLSQALADVIETKLAPRFRSFFALVRAEVESAEFDFSGFSSSWGLEKAADDGGNAEDFQTLVNTTFSTLCGALAYLQDVASECFPPMLANGRQDPALALFVVFLKLYRSAQNELNRFTDKHLDFYYRKYLKFAPDDCCADSAYLVFEPAAGPGTEIPAGAEFSAGKDSEGHEVIYTSEQRLSVTDARVSSLCTLHLSRDEKISPERELGSVVNGYAKELSPRPEGVRAQPIFGAPESGCEASIGIAIASACLLLREGRRRVSVRFNCGLPASLRHITPSELVQKTVNAADEKKFFNGIGKIFRNRLLSPGEVLNEEEVERLLNAAPDASRGVIRELLTQAPSDLFFRYFRQLFRVSISGGEGWAEVTDHVLVPATGSAEQGTRGVAIEFTLGPDFPALVPYDESLHGGGFPTALPLLRLLLNPQAPLYPYSFAEDLLLTDVRLDAKVEGVTDLVAYNNHGQLDPTVPFHPFGPLPRLSSCFIVGSYEMAVKQVLSFDLNIEWGELPKDKGGFEEYYQGYESDLNNDSFEVQTAHFRGGAWLEETRDGSGRRLFKAETPAGQLSDYQHLKVKNPPGLEPLAQAMSEDSFALTRKSRCGFVRFSLSKPAGAFGHKEYPRLLAEVLTHNARNKKHPRPLPNEPYTPLINRLSLDYTARSVLRPGAAISIADSPHTEKIFHIHPFGLEKVHPVDTGGRCTLLPQYSPDSNLFIGLSATSPGGPLSLFFHLLEGSLDCPQAQGPEILWFYLHSNQWRPLSQDRILSDSTEGFIRSGILVLDLPDEVDVNHSVMPGGLFWLRASTKATSDHFCHLRQVKAHALKVTRKGMPTKSEGWDGGAPAGTIVKSLRSLPGINAPSQPLPSFGGRAAETDQSLRRRASERLRHKYRAVTPWDYERLILERFPNLFKVKCFPHMSTQKGWTPHPGRVLVVVLPQTSETGSGKGVVPKVNAADLKEIHDFIIKLSSSFVGVEVRNALYEQIQVRCSVRFSPGLRHGATIRRLNQAICEYLSPWSKGGYQSRFGWCVRRSEIEAFIRSLDYVDFLTDFSMLHITRNDYGFYSLEDTEPHSSKEGLKQEIRPSLPWSLVCPVPKHFIRAIDAANMIQAKPTGIDELEIGTTFIIGGR